MHDRRTTSLPTMWPLEALEFLRELEDSNDRAWFKANRTRYDEHLVAPGRAFAERVSGLGEARFFRPYNDARFHTRPPRGYPIDHARIERLRLKHLTVCQRHPLAGWLHRPAGAERVTAQLEAARPLVAWLTEHVGPSQRSAA